MLKNQKCQNAHDGKYIMRKNYTLNLRKPYTQGYLIFLCKYYELDKLPLYKHHTPFRILTSYRPKGLNIIF